MEQKKKKKTKNAHNKLRFHCLRVYYGETRNTNGCSDGVYIRFTLSLSMLEIPCWSVNSLVVVMIIYVCQCVYVCARVRARARSIGKGRRFHPLQDKIEFANSDCKQNIANVYISSCSNVIIKWPSCSRFASETSLWK